MTSVQPEGGDGDGQSESSENMLMTLLRTDETREVLLNVRLRARILLWNMSLRAKMVEEFRHVRVTSSLPFDVLHVHIIGTWLGDPRLRRVEERHKRSRNWRSTCIRNLRFSRCELCPQHTHWCILFLCRQCTHTLFHKCTIAFQATLSRRPSSIPQ